MKKVFVYIINIFSSLCFMLLVSQPNTNGIIGLAFGVVLGFLITIIFCKTERYKNIQIKSQNNVFSIISAIAFSIFIAFFDGGLLTKYKSWQIITDTLSKINIGENFFFVICSVLLAIGSLPILFTIFNLIFSELKSKKEQKITAFFDNKKFYCFCLVFGLVILGIIIRLCFTYSIEIDDTFSLQLIKRSYADLTMLTATDFHPPLYYYGLKTFMSLFKFIAPNVDEIFIGKLFSVIPYFILLIYSAVCTFKKKSTYFSNGFVIIFSGFFICFFKQVMSVRMYTWGLLLVTFVFIEAKNIILSKDNISTWLKLTILSAACCYTHYFAAVAAVIIYLYLIIWKFISKQKILGKILISGASVAILYSPWIFVLFRQLSLIENSDDTIHVVLNKMEDYVAYFITSDYHYNIKLPHMLFLLLSTIITFACLYKYIKKSKKAENYTAIFGLTLIFSIALFGDIVSFIGNPILLPRYLFMALIVSIATAALILNNSSSVSKCLIVSFSVAFAIINVASFSISQTADAQKSKKLRNTLVSQNVEDIYVDFLESDRALKQWSGCNIFRFVDDYSVADYEHYLTLGSKTTIDVFDKTVFGDDYEIRISHNNDYIINKAKENKSIIVLISHPELVKQLKKLDYIQIEYLEEYDSGRDLYRVSYIV